MANTGGGAYRLVLYRFREFGLIITVLVTLLQSSHRAVSSFKLNMRLQPYRRGRRVLGSKVCRQVVQQAARYWLIYCSASNGIVIATEKKTSSILIDDLMLEKVATVCPNIGIVYSGMGPDFRVLITRARKSAQAYWKMYGEYPPTRILTQEIANVMQQATQSG